MKTVTIGICKEPGTFRAYCAHDGENIAVAKSTSRAEALVQLFDMLATDYCEKYGVNWPIGVVASIPALDPSGFCQRPCTNVSHPTAAR